MTDEQEEAKPILYLPTVEFYKAVESALTSARCCVDAEGRRVAVRVSPFRMALLIRDAITKAVSDLGRCEVQVIDWQEMIAPMKPPFPPEMEAALRVANPEEPS